MDTDALIAKLEAEDSSVMRTLRNTIRENLPAGFEEAVSYGMLSFVIPLSLYPDGYHCKQNEPLPFISIAAMKNHYALYHMGIYADPDLLRWWQEAWKKEVGGKPDMGKSCLRFKKSKQIPYSLVGELCRRMTPGRWIQIYEEAIKR